MVHERHRRFRVQGGGIVTKPPPPIQLDKLFERQPPASVEAERCVLGAMLLAPGVIAEVAPMLSSDAFTKPEHQAIYAGIVKLDGTSSADVMTLFNKLRDDGVLESVGGAAYLNDLLESVPSAVNAVYYAKIVADKHRLRQLATACASTLYEVYTAGTGEETDAIIDRCEASVLAVNKPRTVGGMNTVGEIVFGEAKRLFEREPGTTVGLATGFANLDAVVAGMMPGQLILLAARPSMGKSALALDIARKVSESTGRHVLFFSLEMSRMELAQRLLSGTAAIPSNRIRRGDLESAEWEKLLAAAQDLTDVRVLIDDTPRLAMGGIRARARRAIRQHGAAFVVIDYLGLIQHAGRGGKVPRYEQITEISGDLKALAGELQVPVLALAQLNRNAENRDNNKPKLSDLRDSGSLEQDADTVMLLHREEYYHRDDENWASTHHDKVGLAEVIVAKNRNGECGTAKLTFVAAQTRFKNYERKTYGF